MPNSPLVTVIIPSYNHGQYLDQAIQSVLDQTYDNTELIVVDDGSTDNSHQVVSRYSDNKGVTIILNKKNRGQCAVINQALKIAKGEFISILPSDDWFLPEKTQLQVDKFLSLPDIVGVIYGRGQRFFEDSKLTIEIDLPMYRGFVLDKFIVKGNFVYPVTPMFRRNCFESLRFDESYRAEGEAIFVKLAIQYKFDYVDEVVAVMRAHSYNIGSNIEMMYEDNVRWWNDFFEKNILPEEIKKLRSIPLARIHRMKGLSFITQRRNFHSGRTALWYALQENWYLVLDPRVVTGIILSWLPVALSNGILDRLAGRQKREL